MSYIIILIPNFDPCCTNYLDIASMIQDHQPWYQFHVDRTKNKDKRQNYFSSSHVWMWELDHKEGWAPKTWCFQIVVLEKAFESSLDCKEIKLFKLILKETSSEYSLEGLMLKLKFQYFGHLLQRVNSLEKTLMLGKTEGRRRRGWQRVRWLDSITNSINMNLSKFQETVEDRGAWRAAVHGITELDTT